MLSVSCKTSTAAGDVRLRRLAHVPSVAPCSSVLSTWTSANVACSAIQPKKRKYPFRPDEPGPMRERLTPLPPAPGELQPVPDTSAGKLISKTEIAAFIQRDDLMDQMHRWCVAEAGENGVRNFGLPMNVEPFYYNDSLWGFKVMIYKEGARLADLGIMFDKDEVKKHEWVGRGDDGFPVLEGQVDIVLGQHFEIWKLCTRPVSEELRQAIRLFCSGLVTALNRYYAFGSVYVDDSQ